MKATLRIVIASLCITTCCHTAEQIILLSWNAESGGSDPAIIAQQPSELPRADTYFLQEVDGRDIGRFGAAIHDAHGRQFKYYLSSMGGGDKLAIIVDSDKFLIRSFTV